MVSEKNEKAEIVFPEKNGNEYFIKIPLDKKEVEELELYGKPVCIERESSTEYRVKLFCKHGFVEKEETGNEL